MTWVHSQVLGCGYGGFEEHAPLMPELAPAAEGTSAVFHNDFFETYSKASCIEAVGVHIARATRLDVQMPAYNSFKHGCVLDHTAGWRIVNYHHRCKSGRASR